MMKGIVLVMLAALLLTSCAALGRIMDPGSAALAEIVANEDGSAEESIISMVIRAIAGGAKSGEAKTAGVMIALYALGRAIKWFRGRGKAKDVSDFVALEGSVDSFRLIRRHCKDMAEACPKCVYRPKIDAIAETAQFEIESR